MPIIGLLEPLSLEVKIPGCALLLQEIMLLVNTSTS